MKKTINGLLLLAVILPLVLLFWPFAMWNDGMLLILRVIPSIAVQILLCRTGKRTVVKLLPALLTGMMAVWGTYLYCTSPHWSSATLWNLIADYVSPFICCTIMLLLSFFRKNPRIDLHNKHIHTHMDVFRFRDSIDGTLKILYIETENNLFEVNPMKGRQMTQPPFFQRLITIYLACMVSVFLLYTGGGYARITEQKYLAFFVLSGVFLVVYLAGRLELALVGALPAQPSQTL